MSWLGQIEEELSTLDMLVQQVDGIKFISSRELQYIASNEPDFDYLVCLAFHIALEDDTVIDLLQSYLHTGRVNQVYDLSSQPLKWYMNADLMKKMMSNIDHFKAFANNNSKTKSTVFVVVNCKQSCTGITHNESSSVLLYEDATYIVWEPPGPPGKLTVKEVTHDTVQLEWSKPEYGSQTVECYQVSYRPVSNPNNCSTLATNNAQITTAVSGLTAGTKYEFLVQSKCKVGVGGSIDLVAYVETELAIADLDTANAHMQPKLTRSTSLIIDPHLNSPPSSVSKNPETSEFSFPVTRLQFKPTATIVTHDSISLEWAIPEPIRDDIDCYTVFYRTVDDDPPKKWNRFCTNSSSQSVLVGKLSPQTKYIFRVRPEFEIGVGTDSEVSDPIETKPPLCQPGKPTASVVSSSSITLQWEEPQHGSENIESYLVRYCSVDEINIIWKKATTDSTERLLTIDKLTPETKYLFKVRPEMRDGIGAMSEASDPIETKAHKLFGHLLLGKPTATVVTHSSITIEWSKPEYSSESIECYSVSYRSVDDVNIKWKSITTETANETVTVTDLKIDTNYIFKVRSECRNGTGLSSELSDPIPTAATSSPDKPTTVSSETTHNSIQLNWSKPEYGSEIKQYKILYRSVDECAKTMEEVLTKSTQESILVRGLSANTAYVFQVQPICEGNVGSKSEMSDYIKTKPTSSPSIPSAISKTHNSITLRWNKPKYGSEGVKYYRVQVNFQDTLLKELQTEGLYEEIKVQTLDLNEEYQFKVWPECGDAGVGMVSETSERIKTMATSPPGKPTASNVTFSSIQLQWTKPEKQCTNVEAYEVQYKKVQGTQWRKTISSGPKLTVNVTKGIDFDSEYVFKVIPICDIGEGSESEISVPVRTKATSPPGKPLPSSATHNCVQLEWTKPVYGYENIVEYCIYAFSGLEFKEVTKKSKISGNFDEKVNISIGELASNTEYVFKVQPYSLSGAGDESEPSKPIKTKLVYYKPGKPRAQSTAYDQVKLKWAKPDHMGHKVECYSVYYHALGDSNWIKASDKINSEQNVIHMCMVDSLSPGTKYVFKVKSHIIDSCGKMVDAEESDLSNPIQTEATTAPGKPVASIRSFKSIHLEWTAPLSQSDNIEYYIIKYSKKHGQVVTEHSNVENHEIKGLRSKTQYTFTVIPQCKVGTGEKSESSIVETPPSCRPGKARCVASTYNSITLAWKRPDYYTRDVEHYKLFYHNSRNTEDKRETSVKNEEVTINGLAHNIGYTFEVLPVCANNAVYAIGTECSISDPITTKATSPPGKPIKFCSAHDSITLQWVKPVVGSENIVHYKVLYQEKSKLNSMFSSARNFKEVKTDNFKEKKTVTNLDYNTKYVFKVQAVCATDREDSFTLGMESELSDSISTNTTSPPGKPKAKETTHNSVTLVWEKPRYCSSDIESYIIYMSADGENWTAKSERSELQKSRSSISCTVLNLIPKTSYLFKVFSVCADVTGPYSEVSSPIVTKATAPPGIPTALEVTHDSIHLEWECPCYGNEIIDHYLLLYTVLDKHRETTWTTLSVNCGKRDYCVEKLAMKSEYIFKVIPICKPDLGEGTESEPSEPIKTKATSAPGKPKAINVTHNSVRLEWTRPKIGVPKNYTILFCETEQLQSDKWYIRGCCKNESVDIEQLQPETSYYFRIRPVCGTDGTDSETSIITTNALCKPGKPIASSISHESISLTWSKPHHGSDEINAYIIRFSEKSVSKEPEHILKSNGDRNDIIISWLKHSTEYIFAVCAELKNNDNSIGIEFSEEGQVTTKPLPLAVSMFRRAQSQKLIVDQGPPTIYKVPGITETVRDESKIAKCHVGDPSLAKGRPEKVLMLVGETGAGKSTLVNLLVNYIFGVKWNNDFRFQLIKQLNNAYSQTKFITSYTFYPTNETPFDYTLTIIDTPGYGDTRGIEHDAALTKHIKEFFLEPPPHGISHIDGVGFVTKASSSRLTPTQRYIFDSILDIFGRDMKANIFLMITFCDSQTPVVLEAVAEADIPHVESFKFNNSGLYANNDDEISKLYWQIGVKSAREFFTAFEKMESKSLQLTKQVLEEREQVEILVEGLQRQITITLDLIHELQQEEKVIQTHKTDVDSQEPFLYDVQVMKSFEEPLPEKSYVTVCLQCSFTCHLPCTISNDQKKYNCAAMEGNIITRNKKSCCTVCPGKCIWNKHVNRPFLFVRRQVIEKRSLDDLVTRYIATTEDQQSTAKNMLDIVRKKLEETYNKVLKLIHHAKDSINRLDEIALRKSTRISQVAYIDLLIVAEERGKTPGFEQRIESLKILRDNAQVEDEVAKSARAECNKSFTSDISGVI